VGFVSASRVPYSLFPVPSSLFPRPPSRTGTRVPGSEFDQVVGGEEDAEVGEDLDHTFRAVADGQACSDSLADGKVQSLEQVRRNGPRGVRDERVVDTYEERILCAIECG